MSDLTTQHDDAVEPDEEVLISALRNQDDIPILMDVVSEKIEAGVSQEVYMTQSVEVGLSAAPETDSVDTAQEVVSQEAQQQDVKAQEKIAAAISEVLERRLPELVAEVITVLEKRN
ncbi:hypothetical protein OFY17_14700 [Marinomonas sp. C2222]|uniref:Uncharacterized protein n=1 Tax=Marinomonas sargassi TaxID=2984494 RepID=A0ABT2YW43_9GAMM|nr:hypothetical protein [Marinomonas sargassi]MCV2404113.1 hypothetical protein [Marinomonas sargassi]